MENNEKQKLGAGIIVISVIHLLASAFGVFTALLYIFMGDQIYAQLEAMGQSIPEVPQSQLIIGLVISAAVIIGLVLILLKKALGVYIYFACAVINFAYGIITQGFKLESFSGLVIPALMAFFISQKKELFGLGSGK